MKYTSYFLSVFLLFVLPLMPMENKNKIIIDSSINDIQYPMGMRYLDNDHLIIHDERRFNIINIRQRVAVHVSKYNAELSTLKVALPIVHNGDKKILTLHAQGTQMYNIETKAYDVPRKTEAFHCLYRHKYVHDPLSNSVFFFLSPCSHSIKNYNYITHQCNTLVILGQHEYVMNIDPKKEIVCAADDWGNMLFYHFNNLFAPFKRVCLPIPIEHARVDFYPPQGDDVALVLHQRVFNLDAKGAQEVTAHIPTEVIYKKSDAPLTFHPNGILAMVFNYDKRKCPTSVGDYTICYSDIAHNESVYKTSDQIEGSIVKHFCFSPDGSEYALFLANSTCHIMPVSFKVLYQSNAEQIMRYCLFILNCLQAEQNIPRDITKYIAFVLLTALKR